MGAGAQRGEGNGAVAIRGREGARQAGTPLPFILTLVDY